MGSLKCTTMAKNLKSLFPNLVKIKLNFDVFIGKIMLTCSKMFQIYKHSPNYVVFSRNKTLDQSLGANLEKTFFLLNFASIFWLFLHFSGFCTKRIGKHISTSTQTLVKIITTGFIYLCRRLLFTLLRLTILCYIGCGPIWSCGSISGTSCTARSGWLIH